MEKKCTEIVCAQNCGLLKPFSCTSDKIVLKSLNTYFCGTWFVIADKLGSLGN